MGNVQGIKVMGLLFIIQPNERFIVNHLNIFNVNTEEAYKNIVTHL